VAGGLAALAAMIFEPQAPAEVDEEHLRVLSVLYFVYGGLAACLGLVALLLLGAGAVAGAGSAVQSDQPWSGLVAGCFGYLFAFVGGWLFLLFGTIAALRILTGFALRQHRYRTFCMVVAALSSLEIPIGALLGVATLIVLLRPSVERLFTEGGGGSRRCAPSPPPPTA
jgi:hypothetical protein